MRPPVPETLGKSGPTPRAAMLATTFIAGLIGAGFTYWTWRGVLQVPFELRLSLHMDPAAEKVTGPATRALTR